jgi:hypothetical protein
MVFCGILRFLGTQFENSGVYITFTVTFTFSAAAYADVIHRMAFVMVMQFVP